MIEIEREIYEACLEHARRVTPEEATGVLAGRTGLKTRITRQYETENVAPSPNVTYDVDPEELYTVLEEIDAAGLDLVGFYHSHPAGPPHPSETDRDLAAWDGYRYVIISLGASLPFFDAWLWTGTGFDRETISVTG